MSKCASTCGHYRMVTDYVQERERQELEREEACKGYDVEISEYPPLIDFKQWLIQNRRSTE